MNVKKSNLGIIKGVLIGAVVGIGATILVANQKDIKTKIKKTTQNTMNNVSSMFKMD